ncbi:hypothetical protein KAH81_04415 [bacterium]|nr:hypothetical protein [bacterium]
MEQLVSTCETFDYWRENVGDKVYHIQVLVSSEDSEQIIDSLQKSLSTIDGFRIIILPVEAIILKREKIKKKLGVSRVKKSPLKVRISREEIYEDISEASNFSTLYIVLVLLSAIVAGARQCGGYHRCYGYCAAFGSQCWPFFGYNAIGYQVS